MTHYFTASVFTAIRIELGTLGAIQQLFHARHIDDDKALELLFSIHDITSLREMESLDDWTVYCICENLCDGYKNGLAIKQEMEVETPK